MAFNRQIVQQQMACMSVKDLRDALEWQNALSDHGGEIGESMGGTTVKIEMLTTEIARRERAGAN